MGLTADAPARDADLAVALAGVTKRFGETVAVERVTLAVRRGELLSLLGPSGCGKTTLLRLVAGFERPDAGAIRLDGVDVTSTPAHRRNVHTVFQQYALFPHLSVFENVAFGPRAHGASAREIDRRVREMLAVVRLSDLADRRPRQLSGGQQQRVALARALVNRPSAVLLDEPLSALDPELRRDMQRELQRVQAEVGVTFVLVTHDREEALALSHRVAVMSSGRVEQVGTPEDVYERPASPFVAGFVGAANLLPVHVEHAAGRAAVAVLANGTRVAVASADGPHAEDRGTLLVRPERVEVARIRPPGNAAAFPVTVRDAVFHGPIVRCDVVDAAATAIVAHVAAAAGRELGAGASAWAWWDADAARLLPAEPRGASTDAGARREAAPAGPERCGRA
ncbi:MAG TPA: ABC transporter ATP-binding protein [Candidatus Binatia bacterium]|nr:ABC transporter ATP-binding protein [Candidatus Binatia bacterium]